MATLSNAFTLWASPCLGKVSTCSAQGRTQRPACTQREPHILVILISEIVKSHVLEQEWAGGEAVLTK